MKKWIEKGEDAELLINWWTKAGHKLPVDVGTTMTRLLSFRRGTDKVVRIYCKMKRTPNGYKLIYPTFFSDTKYRLDEHLLLPDAKKAVHSWKDCNNYFWNNKVSNEFRKIAKV